MHARIVKGLLFAGVLGLAGSATRTAAAQGAISYFARNPGIMCQPYNGQAVSPGYSGEGYIMFTSSTQTVRAECPFVETQYLHFTVNSVDQIIWVPDYKINSITIDAQVTSGTGTLPANAFCGDVCEMNGWTTTCTSTCESSSKTSGTHFGLVLATTAWTNDNGGGYAYVEPSITAQTSCSPFSCPIELYIAGLLYSQ
jgi:hypothetical protein